VVRQSSLHRGGYSERLVNTAEVVVHVMDRDSMCVVLNLLAESICLFSGSTLDI
jgi:hypothetical protein